VGPINGDGKYEYLVLTQALKHPTVVLVRDVGRYEGVYRAEITDYLDRYGYMNPPTSLNSPLHFVNTTSCVTSNEYYFDVGEEIVQ